jgi:hypothetical protein
MPGMSNRNGLFRCGSAATAVMNIQCAPNPPLPQRRYAHPAALAASLQQIACPLRRSRKSDVNCRNHSSAGKAFRRPFNRAGTLYCEIL